MQIFVLIAYNKLNKVDGIERLFSADFYLTQWWVDKRLSQSVTVDTDFDPAIHFEPALEFINGDQSSQLNDNPFSFITTPFWVTPELMQRYNISSTDIWCMKDTRYSGDFNTELDLLEFPFDKQLNFV